MNVFINKSKKDSDTAVVQRTEIYKELYIVRSVIMSIVFIPKTNIFLLECRNGFNKIIIGIMTVKSDL